MSKRELGAAELAELFRAVADDLRTRSDELRHLDALMGDGDLGITVNLIAQALTESADASDGTDVGELLADCGRHVNRTNPSTFGTVIAIGLIAAGKSVIGKTELDCDDLLAIGESAIAAIEQRGKAKVGDKTMLDTLVPAVETVKQSLADRLESKVTIAAVVRAAKEGMEATAQMRAQVGRARMFQERSVGIQDAGATAVYYMIESLARNVASQGSIPSPLSNSMSAASDKLSDT